MAALHCGSGISPSARIRLLKENMKRRKYGVIGGFMGCDSSGMLIHPNGKRLFRVPVKMGRVIRYIQHQIVYMICYLKGIGYARS